MPKLLLLRHAKSSWADPGMNDSDRPLSSEGQRVAKRMAEEIAHADLLPDSILCSPARRTRETLAALSGYLAGDCSINFCEELYQSAQSDYRAAITSYGSNPERLLVIGHNPTIHATALSLIGSAETKSAAKIAGNFPTAALAVFGIGARNWRHLPPKCGHLEAFIRPRDLSPSDRAADDD